MTYVVLSIDVIIDYLIIDASAQGISIQLISKIHM